MVATLTAVTAAAAAPSPGAAGLGDPFFPEAGNGGYDVHQYSLDLRYLPDSNRLSGRATIFATATQDLSRFDLDYRGPAIEELTVGVAPATYSRQGQELVITPSAPIQQGLGFSVTVTYEGHPHPLEEADGSLEGWIPTDDGAFVAGEPQGAPTWFPCNDSPTDKAQFDITIRAPGEVEVIGNGKMTVRRRAGGGMSQWTWRTRQPMATYLATATIGNFELERSSFDGIKSIVAVDPRERRESRRALRKIPSIVRLFSSLFGAYPFGQTGAIVDHAPKVGYALETQTRPIYDRAPDDALVAHELAHQWFGDSISLTTWPEIWLNEGFATWAEWRWAEESGGPTTAQVLADLNRTPASADGFWNPPPAALPGPAKLFSDPVYVRGAMALETVRQRVGNGTFLAILREWATSNAYANVTIADFIALAEARSAQELSPLFDAWLYQPGKP